MVQLPRLGHDPAGQAVTPRFKEWIEGAQLQGSRDTHIAFATAEVDERLTGYRRAEHWWRAAQVAAWALIIILGLLGAALGGTGSHHTIAVLAGGLVATLTAFTQAAHPGRQADGYEAARRAIRDEVWALLEGVDQYAKLDTDEERWKTCVTEIRKIVRDKRGKTQLELP